MGSRVRPIPLPRSRLLTLSEAASYCSLTTSVFERTCPVMAINLSPDGRDDKRLLRYDVLALNDWIDMIGGRLSGKPEHRDWLAEIPD
jgi:hypothetical protein